MDGRTGPIDERALMNVAPPMHNHLAPPPPSFIFILMDDTGFNDIGYQQTNRTVSIRTPRIDAACSKGVKLSNYYVQPICTPTRRAYDRPLSIPLRRHRLYHRRSRSVGEYRQTRLFCAILQRRRTTRLRFMANGISASSKTRYYRRHAALTSNRACTMPRVIITSILLMEAMTGMLMR